MTFRPLILFIFHTVIWIVCKYDPLGPCNIYLFFVLFSYFLIIHNWKWPVLSVLMCDWISLYVVIYKWIKCQNQTREKENENKPLNHVVFSKRANQVCMLSERWRLRKLSHKSLYLNWNAVEFSKTTLLNWVQWTRIERTIRVDCNCCNKLIVIFHYALFVVQMKNYLMLQWIDFVIYFDIFFLSSQARKHAFLGRKMIKIFIDEIKSKIEKEQKK